MSTMKNHLADFHKRASEHHANMAGHFQRIAKCVEKTEAANGSGKETLSAMADEHVAMSEYHSAACDKCAKAAASDLEKANQVMPTRVSAIAPTAPARAVPRFGQPETPAAAAVPYQFAKLVEIDERDDWAQG
jgi:hypothetical protein